MARFAHDQPQRLSNTPLALAKVGWYDPAVYDNLLEALAGQTLNAQDMANGEHACGLAKHATRDAQWLGRAVLAMFNIQQ